MIKDFTVSHLKMIQELWQPYPDDKLLSAMDKLMAMLVVAADICIVGLVCWLIVLCVIYPMLAVYSSMSVLAVFAATYIIAHMKL